MISGLSTIYLLILSKIKSTILADFCCLAFNKSCLNSSVSRTNWCALITSESITNRELIRSNMVNRAASLSIKFLPALDAL
uniref:hypothetical protein n=1 Tax=Succinivibrio sp. TaxID=2053619 RepID=UPI00402A7AF0